VPPTPPAPGGRATDALAAAPASRVRPPGRSAGRAPGLRTLAAAAAALAAALAAAAVAPARAQAPDPARFEAEIRAFEAATARRRRRAGAALFVGSSSIRLWCTLDRDFPDQRVVNRGFGGSTMAEVLRYAPRVVLPYRPRTVVVYAGDNDLAEGRTPAEVRDAYRRFTALVRARLPTRGSCTWPSSRARAREAPAAVRATNAVLRATPRATRAPPTSTCSRRCSAATPAAPGAVRRATGLHMNSAGYALWRAALAPALAAPGARRGGGALGSGPPARRERRRGGVSGSGARRRRWECGRHVGGRGRPAFCSSGSATRRQAITGVQWMVCN
jgi:lysophospholipase L1-like esterase